jgi:hypothetical protein
VADHRLGEAREVSERREGHPALEVEEERDSHQGIGGGSGGFQHRLDQLGVEPGRRFEPRRIGGPKTLGLREKDAEPARLGKGASREVAGRAAA